MAFVDEFSSFDKAFEQQNTMSEYNNDFAELNFPLDFLDNLSLEPSSVGVANNNTTTQVGTCSDPLATTLDELCAQIFPQQQPNMFSDQDIFPNQDTFLERTEITLPSPVDNETDTCQICFDATPDQIPISTDGNVPCMHKGLVCSGCWAKLENCPYCRAPTNNVLTPSDSTEPQTLEEQQLFPSCSNQHHHHHDDDTDCHAHQQEESMDVSPLTPTSTTSTESDTHLLPNPTNLKHSSVRKVKIPLTTTMKKSGTRRRAPKRDVRGPKVHPLDSKLLKIFTPADLMLDAETWRDKLIGLPLDHDERKRLKELRRRALSRKYSATYRHKLQPSPAALKSWNRQPKTKLK